MPHTLFRIERPLAPRESKLQVAPSHERRYGFFVNRDLSSYDSLSIEERIRVLQELWDELGSVPERVPVTAAQEAELDARLADHESTPDDVVEWPLVRRPSGWPG